MVRFHFGDIDAPCSSEEQASATAGTLAWQYKDDAQSVYKYDTRALVPACVFSDSTDPSGKKKIVYKQAENIWVWSVVGLLGFIVLILIVLALKGGGGSNSSAPIIFKGGG